MISAIEPGTVVATRRDGVNFDKLGSQLDLVNLFPMMIHPQ